MLDNLHFVKQLGHEIKDALEAGDLRAFAKLMDLIGSTKRSERPE